MATNASTPRLPALFTLMAAFLAAPASGGAVEENWTEFRGPTGQGHSSAAGLPAKWGQRENVAWKIPVPGHGWSSPVLVDNRLYLTTAVEAKPGAKNSIRSLRALCLDAENGEILWDAEVFHWGADDASRVHEKNSHASATPVYEDGKLYVHFGHDGTACLDAATGNVLWRQTSLRYPPVHGNGGSPMIVDDNLIFSCDGGEDPFIVALDKSTGEVKWKTSRDVEVQRPFSFSTPLLIEVNGARQIISPGSGAVMAYDPESGREIWRCRYGEGYSVVPRPSFAHGFVYVCTGFGQPNLLAIRPDGSGDVTDSHVAWQISKAVPKTSSPIVVGDLLFMVDDKGVATCLDAKSGQVIWQDRLGGNFSASPIHADGKLFFPSEEGVIHVLEAGRRLRPLAENDMGERTFATVIPGEGRLFIRGEEHLFCIGQKRE